MTVETNMPWGVFHCDRMARGPSEVRNAALISGHLTAMEAMLASEALRRDPRKSYFVASADYPVEETRASVAA